MRNLRIPRDAARFRVLPAGARAPRLTQRVSSRPAGVIMARSTEHDTNTSVCADSSSPRGGPANLPERDVTGVHQSEPAEQTPECGTDGTVRSHSNAHGSNAPVHTAVRTGSATEVEDALRAITVDAVSAGDYDLDPGAVREALRVARRQSSHHAATSGQPVPTCE